MNERVSIGNSLDTKDYFHYYFSGIIWIMDFFLLFFEKLPLINIIQTIPTVESIVLIVVIPYVVGFILSPFGNCITKLIRKIFNDPVNWVLPLKSYKTGGHEGKRLAEVWKTELISKIKKALLGEKDIKYSPFFWVRTYVELFSPENGRKLANRALTLANLTESLILPSSLLSFLILKQIELWGVGLLLSILIFSILCYRYLQLREYWVKHVYRVFYLTQDQK